MRHHGDLLAGESHPVHPAPSAFGARPRNLSSFTCPTQYGIEARGGGQAPRGDSAPFVTPPRFRQPFVIRFALPTRAFLDERRILSTFRAFRTGDGGLFQFFLNEPPPHSGIIGSRSSCRKTGADAQNIPVRGRLKGRRPSFTRHPQCTTWAFANRRQLRRRNMDRKCSPRYPEREYFAHSGGKNDNMPPGDPKGGAGPRDDAPRARCARRTPDTQAPGVVLRMDELEQTSVPCSKCKEESPPKSGSFLSSTPHRWAASRQKTSRPRLCTAAERKKPEARRAPRVFKCSKC